MAYSFTMKVFPETGDPLESTVTDATPPVISIAREQIRRIEIHDASKHVLGFEEMGIDEFLADPVRELTKKCVPMANGGFLV